MCWWGVKPVGKLQTALPSQARVGKGRPVGSCLPHTPACPTACAVRQSISCMLLANLNASHSMLVRELHTLAVLCILDVGRAKRGLLEGCV